jgi:hypothetical protein
MQTLQMNWTSSSKLPMSWEAPLFLKVLRAEIAGEHDHHVHEENMHYLAPAYLPTYRTSYWGHMFELAVVFMGLLGL